MHGERKECERAFLPHPPLPPRRTPKSKNARCGSSTIFGHQDRLRPGCYRLVLLQRFPRIRVHWTPSGDENQFFSLSRSGIVGAVLDTPG